MMLLESVLTLRNFIIIIIKVPSQIFGYTFDIGVTFIKKSLTSVLRSLLSLIFGLVSFIHTELYYYTSQKPCESPLYDIIIVGHS